MRRTIALVVPLLVLLVGVFVWYVLRPRPWPEEVRDGFLRSCIVTASNTLGADQKVAYCECAVAEAQRQMTFEQFKQEEALVLANGMQLTPALVELTRTCASRLLPRS